MADTEARMTPEDMEDIGFRMDWTRFYSPTTTDLRMYSGPPVTTEAEEEPVVLSIDATSSPDSTTVRIEFNVAAKNNNALRTPGNYVITPDLEVLSVTPEAGDAPTYVLLTTEEQKQDEEYSVEIQNVVKKAI